MQMDPAVRAVRRGAPFLGRQAGGAGAGGTGDLGLSAGEPESGIAQLEARRTGCDVRRHGYVFDRRRSTIGRSNCNSCIGLARWPADAAPGERRAPVEADGRPFVEMRKARPANAAFSQVQHKERLACV